MIGLVWCIPLIGLLRCINLSLTKIESNRVSHSPIKIMRLMRSAHAQDLFLGPWVGSRAGRYIDIWNIYFFFQPRYGTRRCCQHRYSLICVESTGYFIQITAASNRDCRLLFRNSAYLSPALPPAHTYTAWKMESAGKCGTEELVCKQKTNGSIVWKCFGYQVSDEWQNQVFFRECWNLSRLKGRVRPNLFHHLQQHNVLKNACSDPKS
jgi:hypothetical protein